MATSKRTPRRTAADRRLFKELDAARTLRQSKTALAWSHHWWAKLTPDEKLEFLRQVRIG